jgi:hypothetical protein
MQQAPIVGTSPKTAITIAQELTEFRGLPAGTNQVRPGLLIDELPDPVQGSD